MHLSQALPQLPSLRTLDLSGSMHVTDAGVKHVVKVGPLETLRLGKCPQLTDHSLEYIGASCKTTLTALDVTQLTKITPAGVKIIAQRCGFLRKLNLMKCPNINDAALEALALGCTRLEVGTSRLYVHADLRCITGACAGGV